jgi:hypothetical protein
VESANFVAEHFDEVIQDLSDWGLTKLKNGLGYTRNKTVMTQCCNMADLIFPCIQDGSILSMKLNKSKTLDLELEEGEVVEEDSMDEMFTTVQDTKKRTIVENDDSGVRRRKRRKIVEIDEKSSFLSSKFISEITQSKQQCVVVMKRLLYMPAVNKKASNMLKEIVTRLRVAGFVQAANTLWVNAATPQHNYE